MPRLKIQSGDGVGRDTSLGARPCVVGRDPGVDFILDDTVASRRHFRIVPVGGTWILEDLGSTNGTFVNDARVRRVQLKDGDVIRVGSTRMVYVQKDIFGGTASNILTAPKRRRRRLRG